MLKLILYFALIIIVINCSEKTIYSGKIINQDNFTYKHIKSKKQLIDELGEANYIDPIENKFFYFTEKRKFKNLFDEKINTRNIIVFKFNDNDNIELVEEFSLKDEKEINFTKDKTKNDLIKLGLIQKIFGGVSRSPQIPNTAN